MLRTPKGWTGPHEVDGHPVEGTLRSHQVPLAGVRENPEHLAQLERWMRSYRPRSASTPAARSSPSSPRSRPTATCAWARCRTPTAAACSSRSTCPTRRRTRSTSTRPAAVRAESTRALGELLRDVYRRNPDSFRLFCPDETNSNRLGAVFADEDRMLRDARPDDEHVSPHGRVMEVLSEHNCQGWLEGYLLTGRHGLFATYEAFAMVSASMAIQHAKWLQHGRELHWRAPVASLNVLLTSTCWRNDNNGFSHQGPGLIDTMISMSGSVVRVYLPPDANCLLWTADHCLRSRDYVNLVVIDKQPELQYLDIEAAREHCARGAGEWAWAGNALGDEEADVVLACIGDVPTQETIAAAALLREHVPELRFRVVNVVDLMAITPAEVHPHGMSRDRFEALFGETTNVVCAFHGYARALHQLLHGRPHAGRFHVHGYSEQGTTTTPFDMVVLNEMSRYHLVLDALRRARRIAPGARALERHCEAMLAAPPRLHPRAPRGHARGARLDLAAGRGLSGRDRRARPRRQRRLEQPQARARRHRRRRRSSTRGEQRWDPDADAGRHAAALRAALADAGGGAGAEAVGHRVVHGGARFTGPARIDAATRAAIAALAPLAPLHTRAALEGIDAAAAALPGLPQVACFDTAFHRTLPAEAATYALPREWSERFALRRYGFHGLNVAVVRTSRRRGSSARTALPAARRLPPRQRLLGERRARRALGRHDDGLHAAGRRADGDALGVARPGAAAAPARRPASRATSSPRRSTTAPACSASAGSPGCARSSAPRAPATSARSSRSTSSCAASAARSRR